MPPPSVPLNAIRQPAFLYGPDGAITDANGPAEALAGRRLAGLSPADVVRTFRHRRRDGTNLAPRELPACRALRGEEVVEDPFAVALEDGRSLDVLASASAIRDGDAVAGALVVWQDVTEGVNAEEAMRVSEERFQAVYEHSRDAIILFDPQNGGRIIAANPAAGLMFGYADEELVGRSGREMVVDPAGPEAAIIREQERSGRATADLLFRRRDGSTFPGEVSSSLFTDCRGEPRAVSIIRDVTERRRADEEQGRYAEDLRESRQQLADVIAATGAGYYRVALDGSCGTISPRGAELLGLSPGEPPPFAVFAPWARSRVHPDDLQMLLDSFAVFLAGGTERSEAAFRVLGRDGDYRWVQAISTSAERDEAGRVVMLAGFLFDVDEQKKAEEALRTSEERLRDVLDLSLDAVYRRDLVTGRFDYISPVHEVLTGYTAEEFGACSLEEFVDRVHPDDRAKVNAIIAETMRGTCPRMSGTIEYRFRCRDGSYRWLSDHFTFQAEDGRPRYRVGVIRDVTRRKEIEAALRERDLRLNLALDVAAVGTFDWTIATGEETWDDRIRVQWGLPPGGRVDHAIFEAGVHPDDLPAVREANRRALDPDGDGRYAAEYRVIGLCDGVERRISARGQAFFDGDRPVRMIGTTIDITEQRGAEEAAREQERILQSIFRAAPVGIGLVSGLGPGRRLLQANDQLIAMTGYDRGELIGRDTRLLYLDDEAYAAVGRGLAHQLEACGRGEVETRWRRRDGAVFDLRISSSLIDPGDSDGVVVFIAVDLTNLHESERSLQRYARDLARSNEELQRFAYVASHDLQEPLRSVVSFSQLLERRYHGKLDADADEFIAFIVEGGLRMQQLILDLLQVSRIETQGEPAAPTDANGPADDALRSLESAIREAGARVTIDPLPTVMADASQLAQVFVNLIGNAIKYRHPDRPLEVRVSAERQNGMVEFAVADNGIGIEAEYFDRIFEMFRRLHTHDEYEGTGIGLAVVKRIVERQGGRIRVESRPGEGSTFVFTLPAA